MNRRGENVTIIDLTFMSSQLLKLVDLGLSTNLSIPEVKGALEYGDIYETLDEKFHSELDLGLLSADAKSEIKALFAEFAEIIREGRKLGIRKDGVCLLIAYCIEGIQRLTPQGS